MKRTTVLLPQDLRARAMRRASELGISFGELLRRALEDALARPAEADPLFDDVVHDGLVPDDLAQSHDRYLYGPGGE